MKVSCLHPYIIGRGRFHVNENGLVVSDEMHLPCGKCEVCLAKRQRDWSLRLQMEHDASFNCAFVTLTYSNEYLPKINGVPSLNYVDVQLFLKRLRTYYDSRYPGSKKIRFYMCGEYGPTTLRPHYHILFFNIPTLRGFTKVLENTWKKGFVQWKQPSRDHFTYLTTYVNFHDKRLQSLLQSKQIMPPFRRMSLRKAIGYCYLERGSRIDYHRKTLDTVITLHGYKYAMPRFYRDRIFDTEEARLVIRQRAVEYFEKQSDEYFEVYGYDDCIRLSEGRLTNYEEAVQAYLQNYYRKLNRQKYHRKI